MMPANPLEPTVVKRLGCNEAHLHWYVDESALCLNEGNVERHTLVRLDSFVDGVAGKRLTYKALIA
jgi:hypothetical protein